MYPLIRAKKKGSPNMDCNTPKEASWIAEKESEIFFEKNSKMTPSEPKNGWVLHYKKTVFGYNMANFDFEKKYQLVL